MYDMNGDLVVVLPPDRFCALLEIGPDVLKDTLSGKRKAPKGLIVVQLPNDLPQRMPPLKMQKWRRLWKSE